jgi:hypothetical protein
VSKGKEGGVCDWAIVEDVKWEKEKRKLRLICVYVKRKVKE